MRPRGRSGWDLGAGRRKKCQRWKKGPAPTSAGPVLPNSVIIPEKLDSFINKFAEYTHEKWAFDKVGIRVFPSPGPSIPTSFPQAPQFPVTP